MIKDTGQKELLYRHFRARGWYALLEVPVYNRAGAHANKFLITDIDVLALRPTPDLRWELVVGDCKTKRGESPANRTLWARSLMDQFGASSGIVMLRQDRRSIETDHRLFAQRLGITLIEENDFDAYDRAMIYPAGSRNFVESVETLQSIRSGVPQRFTGFHDFAEYLNGRAWNEPDHFMVLRNSIGVARSTRTEVDPGRAEHLALILEGAGVFAVALATCVGVVFHQYLQVNERETLDQALKVLVWGGREQYEYISSLWTKLLEAKGGSADELALPLWGSFIQLVRSCLDAPHFVFQIPQLLRRAALDVMEGNEPLASIANLDPMLLKLAMLAAVYYAEAGRFPTETKTRLRDLIGRRIATAAVGASTQPTPSPPTPPKGTPAIAGNNNGGGGTKAEAGSLQQGLPGITEPKR